MPLAFSISPASDVPIFRQVMEQVRRQVATGGLAVGDQLPAVRVLAELILVNPNTVARAYQELIREGLLESRAGRGVFVAERRQVYSDAERQRRMTRAAEVLCHEAALLNATLADVQGVVRTVWKDMQRKPGGPS